MQTWAIHYNDSKKHPHQPENITEGIVVCGWDHEACRIILAQFDKAVNFTKCELGFVEDNKFTQVSYSYVYVCHGVGVPAPNETD